jgi:hypothetical protein
MKNQYPVSSETSERQRGGNTNPSGERHNQPKAKTVPENKRYSEAENASLENSPGREK